MMIYVRCGSNPFIFNLPWQKLTTFNNNNNSLRKRANIFSFLIATYFFLNKRKLFVSFLFFLFFFLKKEFFVNHNFEQTKSKKFS